MADDSGIANGDVTANCSALDGDELMGSPSTSTSDPKISSAEDIPGSVTSAASPGIMNKNYKTTLCQYYLKGPCKNGDKCSYAHGTSELRTSSGLPVSDVASGSGKPLQVGSRFKTSLCSRFVTNGSCPFGHICNFAHGIQELRQAAEYAAGDVNHGPNYKRVMCKNFAQGLFCPFADKCQYAHGKYELRSPEKMSTEDKKKRLDKAKQMPGYKTKLCQNFDKNQSCDFDDLCLYAHGKDELREATSEEIQTLQIRSNPLYKTVMCNNLKKGYCEQGEHCMYAHDTSELRQPSETNKKSSKYRTQLCQFLMATGHCDKGRDCPFAHSRSEQQRSQTLGIVQKPGHPPKFKTTMCTIVFEGGLCPRGLECHFAHSLAELNAAQRADPKFKTELCVNYVNQGYCERENNCKFAHGQVELRPVRPSNAALPTYINNDRDNYKTMMCKHAALGLCQRGDACHFAHDQNELRQRSFLPQQMYVFCEHPQATKRRNFGQNQYVDPYLICDTMVNKRQRF